MHGPEKSSAGVAFAGMGVESGAGGRAAFWRGRYQYPAALAQNRSRGCGGGRECAGWREAARRGAGETRLQRAAETARRGEKGNFGLARAEVPALQEESVCRVCSRVLEAVQSEERNDENT